MEREGDLGAALRDVDTSLAFLLLILLGTMLFYLAAVRDRDALVTGTASDDAASRRLRWAGGALVTGAVGWFFHLSVKSCRSAQGAGRPTAARNLWASALALGAALLRLWDREAAPQEAAADTGGA